MASHGTTPPGQRPLEEACGGFLKSPALAWDGAFCFLQSFGPQSFGTAQAVKRSPLLPIFLIVLVDILGLTIMIPLLPFYAEHLARRPRW